MMWAPNFMISLHVSLFMWQVSDAFAAKFTSISSLSQQGPSCELVMQCTALYIHTWYCSSDSFIGLLYSICDKRWLMQWRGVGAGETRKVYCHCPDITCRSGFLFQVVSLIPTSWYKDGSMVTRPMQGLVRFLVHLAEQLHRASIGQPDLERKTARLGNW